MTLPAYYKKLLARTDFGLQISLLDQLYKMYFQTFYSAVFRQIPRQLFYSPDVSPNHDSFKAVAVIKMKMGRSAYHIAVFVLYVDSRVVVCIIVVVVKHDYGSSAIQVVSCLVPIVLVDKRM